VVSLSDVQINEKHAIARGAGIRHGKDRPYLFMGQRWNCVRRLGVIRNGDYGNLPLLRPVVPKNSVGCWGVVFYVSLPNLHLEKRRQRCEFVGVQTGMPRVLLQIAECSFYLLRFLGIVALERTEVGLRFGREDEFEFHLRAHPASLFGFLIINRLLGELCK
jgi:hypothetical protein